MNNVNATLLESIKKEFEGITFQVSQKMIWANGELSYKSQLEKFKNLKELIESKLSQIKSDQSSFQEKTKSFNINSKMLVVDEDNESELLSALTEIILEGLCWTQPKILDKKEAGYVSA